MRKRALILALAVLPVLAAVGAAVAAGAFDGPKNSTARFHDIEQAKAAGYTAVIDKAGLQCIAQVSEGAMGIHMLNPDLLFDGGKVDADKPELLVYERRNDGSMKRSRSSTSSSSRTGRAPRDCSARSSTRSRPTTATASRRRGRCTPGSGSRTRAACSTPGTRGSTVVRGQAREAGATRAAASSRERAPRRLHQLTDHAAMPRPGPPLSSRRAARRTSRA